MSKPKNKLTVDPEKKYCPTCGYAEWTKKSPTGKTIYLHGGICHKKVELPNSYIDPTRKAPNQQKYMWPRQRPVTIYTPEGCVFWKEIWPAPDGSSIKDLADAMMGS